ncbi:MAG TPA: patatin-like phospholipase family protein [Usitatibacter sp.]|nr:patatin-like phospholipase family protein [Usitatibacter sp.]
MPQRVLTLRAGARALARIRESGLDPADVELIPGAAGGPKGLGIAALDRAIFGEWLPGAPRVRHLVGASIGAWRFAAVCRRDPVAALERFAQLYIEQCYPPRPSRGFVTRCARETLADLFTGREAEVLSNPSYRLHILAVRGRWPLTRDTAWHTALGFGMAAMANALGRRHLARFIDRTLFHDPRGRPPFVPVGAIAAAGASESVRFDAFHTHVVPLDAANLGEALLASASIPLVLEGVAGIPQAPPGVYWDGGIIDYHLHLPYHRAKGLVLYPHFGERIVPGWLDKGLPWRRARGEWLENVVLVAPSREYLARLPLAKLPDRSDFRRFAGDDAGRMRYWRTAVAESERLAEAFLDFARRPDPSLVRPL